MQINCAYIERESQRKTGCRLLVSLQGHHTSLSSFLDLVSSFYDKNGIGCNVVYVCSVYLTHCYKN